MSTPHVPHAPRATRAPQATGRVRSLVEPTRARESWLAAAVAVGAVIVVKFAVALVQLIGNAVDFDPASYASGFLRSPVGLFLGSLVLFPFLFYVGAFAALAFVAPITRRAGLPLVLARSVAAGAVGTVLLAVAGLVTGVSALVSGGSVIDLLLDTVFVPLSAGITLTGLLVGGSVLGWLWLARLEPAPAIPTVQEPGLPTDTPSAATAPAPQADAVAPADAPPVAAPADPAPAPAPAPAPEAPSAPDYSRFRPPA